MSEAEILGYIVYPQRLTTGNNKPVVVEIGMVMAEDYTSLVQNIPDHPNAHLVLDRRTEIAVIADQNKVVVRRRVSLASVEGACKAAKKLAADLRAVGISAMHSPLPTERDVEKALRGGAS